MSPFLTTNSFITVLKGLRDSKVEGIFWKKAVPKNVINAISEFDFSKIIGRQGNGYSCGRDVWKNETVVQKTLSEDHPELSCLDEHTNSVQRLFKESKDIDIPKSRSDSLSCHFVSTLPLLLSNQTPHVDSPSNSKILSGMLGAEWVKCATPSNYPSYKVLSTMNDDSTSSTILIPYEDRGIEDSDHPGHFPNANTTNAEHAEYGDIVILKQCVTLHKGPENIDRRWVTVY